MFLISVNCTLYTLDKTTGIVSEYLQPNWTDYLYANDNLVVDNSGGNLFYIASDVNGGPGVEYLIKVDLKTKTIQKSNTDGLGAGLAIVY